MPKTVSKTARVSSGWTIITIFKDSVLRPAALISIRSIFRNFFFLQYKAVILPNRIPVSQADHPLDGKIPFTPGKVEIYMDFLHFCIRTMGFLLHRFGQSSLETVKGFIESLGSLYGKAGEVYAKNLSTTRRPRYLGRFKFAVIHTFDPHLMCIPSLHVMVVIFTYTRFRKAAQSLGAPDWASLTGELRRHALDITEAVLYIKQHSVNCVSAAMYAMTRFDGLFPPEEAEAFVRDLFRGAADIPETDTEAIRNHILGLYRHFVEQKAPAWEKPLLDFLESMPKNIKGSPS